jgi:hypothetical protein
MPRQLHVSDKEIEPRTSHEVWLVASRTCDNGLEQIRFDILFNPLKQRAMNSRAMALKVLRAKWSSASKLAQLLRPQLSHTSWQPQTTQHHQLNLYETSLRPTASPAAFTVPALMSMRRPRCRLARPVERRGRSSGGLLLAVLPADLCAATSCARPLRWPGTPGARAAAARSAPQKVGGAGGASAPRACTACSDSAVKRNMLSMVCWAAR